MQPQALVPFEPDDVLRAWWHLHPNREMDARAEETAINLYNHVQWGTYEYGWCPEHDAVYDLAVALADRRTNCSEKTFDSHP